MSSTLPLPLTRLDNAFQVAVRAFQLLMFQARPLNGLIAAFRSLLSCRAFQMRCQVHFVT
jgi:hypothetical protein